MLNTCAFLYVKHMLNTCLSQVDIFTVLYYPGSRNLNYLKQEAERPLRSPEYHRLYTNFSLEGLMFVIKNPIIE